MKVISLLSRKGGSGKTTLALHWAVEANNSKQKVVLMDLDKQQSSSSWFSKREAKTPLLIQSRPDAIKEHIEVCLHEGIDLVIIDTPPDIDTSAVYAARVSDLVVIPTRPSVLDLEAIGSTVELIKGLKKTGVLVLNQAPPNSSVTQEAKTALSSYGVAICPVVLSSRIVISRALINGQVAQEIDRKGKAAIEVSQSWNWILQQLKGESRG